MRARSANGRAQRPADHTDNGWDQERRDDNDRHHDKFDDARRPERRGRAAPAFGQMEFVRREAFGGVPVDHWRLDQDADQGGEIEMGRTPQRSQWRAGDEEHRNANGQKNAIVLGQHREPERYAGGIEPAESRSGRLPFFCEDQEQMDGEDAKEDQQVVVERDAAHQPEQRRGKVESGGRPEPGAWVFRLQPFGPKPEDAKRAREGEPSERPDGEQVPAEEEAHQPHQPGMEWRMVEVRPCELLAPHPVVGFVANRGHDGREIDLDGKEDRDGDLRDQHRARGPTAPSFSRGHGQSPSPAKSRTSR